jgi:hypothetical protein
MTKKVKTSTVKMITEIEIEATKELRETPLSCWALVNELSRARSIVFAVSRYVYQCSLQDVSDISHFRALSAPRLG